LTADEGSERSAEAPQLDGAVTVWTRIRAHKIIQWGVAYLGVAFALAQAEDLIGRAFDWPELAGRAFIVLLIIGFPVALTVAWYHGHRGLRRMSAGEFAILSALLLIGATFFTIAVRPRTEIPPSAAGADRAAPSSAYGGETVRGPPAPANSIAVLPFVNISTDPGQEVFADGLSEELMNQLTKIDELLVTARTSSFAFKGQSGDIEAIRRRLGVSHVLEGSVRKNGERIKITAQLIETATGFHLWSETYERSYSDVFELQDEISRKVATALKVKLQIGDADFRRGGTTNTAAYDEYLLGRSLERQANGFSVEASEAYERALALDPRFGLAQVRYAEQLTALVRIGDRGSLERRDSAMERALELAPDLPGTSALLAQQRIDDLQWRAAEQALKGALASSPNDYEANLRYGQFLVKIGRARESLPFLDRVRLLDPLAVSSYSYLAFAYDGLGERDRAIGLYDEMWQRIEPKRGGSPVSNFATVVFPQFWRVIAGGDSAAALRVLTKAGISEATVPDALTPLAGLLTSPQRLDDKNSGIASLHAAYEHPVAPELLNVYMANLALLAAHFGDADLSVDALGKALRENTSWLNFAWTPLMEPVRRHPKFKELIRETKLPEYWRQSRWPEHCRPLGAEDFECF
jgi:TolB-like protein